MPADHLLAVSLSLDKEAGLGDMAMRGVGRVMTNLVRPQNYTTGEKFKAIAKAGPLNSIRAVVKDRPIYPVDELTRARELPYRRMFGLPSRKFGLGVFTKNEPGSFRFNARRGEGAMSVDDIFHDSSGKAGPFTGKQHLVMGTYAGTAKPGSVGYRDVWDMALNKGESAMFSGANALRWLLSKITRPVTIEGRISTNTPLLNSLPPIK